MATLFGCHGNIPSQIGKKVKIHHLHVNRFHVENIVKIRPVYPEIFNEICQFFGRFIPDVHK